MIHDEPNDFFRLTPYFINHIFYNFKTEHQSLGGIGTAFVTNFNSYLLREKLGLRYKIKGKDLKLIIKYFVVIFLSLTVFPILNALGYFINFIFPTRKLPFAFLTKVYSQK